MASKNSEGNLYGIGAVTEQTGLTAPSLRMWEKRYGAVIPQRSETNRRLYRAEDLARLILLKKLTGHGHSISRIANLDLEQLQGLIREVGEEGAADQNRVEVRSRVGVIGSGLGDMMNDLDLFEADLVGRVDDLEAAGSIEELFKVDLLVVEAESLFLETISLLREVVQRCEAESTLVVFRFASSRTVTALAKAIDGVRLLKAPVSEIQLRRESLVLLNEFRSKVGSRDEEGPGPVPERLYDADQLMRLSRISTTIECECPQHMAELLKSLSAFEKYSERCEDRNVEDALLHAFLHRTTAQVRRTMEEALRHLIKTEGIKLE